MKFGSLFSGVGGMDLGLERAGLECRWQIENDPYAVRVLEKHWPDVTRYGDITEVDFGSVEPVELLAGGFPCQDLSYAGKGLGLSGPRSGLWSEFKRAVRVVGPRLVLVENVPALLGRGMGVVVGDLAALGYDVEWESVPAAALGAPHLRYRVFIVAHADESGRGGRTGQLGAGRRSESSDRRIGDVADSPGVGCRTGRARRPDTGGSRQPEQPLQALADPDGQGPQGRVFGGERARERLARARREAEQTVWSSDAGIRRVAHGVPRRVDRLRGLGNAVVPQVAQWIGERILEFDAKREVG